MNITNYLDTTLKFDPNEFKERLNKPRIIEENKLTSNGYFEQSNKYASGDLFGRDFDLSSLLMSSGGGYLKGTLSDKNDVDYYAFNIAQYRILNQVDRYNQDITITLDNIPKGCDYEIILYDKDGNQVGIGKDNGAGGKSVTIPNWDTSAEFTVKIMSFGEVSPSENYHISFSTEVASKECGAYQQRKEGLPYVGILKEKLHNKEDTTDVKNALAEIDNKYKQLYNQNMNDLHIQQLKDIGVTEDQLSEENMKCLLEKYTSGEDLTTQEKQILIITANAKEYDKISSEKELNSSSSQTFEHFLKEQGIDVTDKNISFCITQSGTVKVEGDLDEESNKKVASTIEKWLAKDLWSYYISISGETEKLTRTERESLADLVDLERFLYAASGGKTCFADLSISKNGYIEDLPANIASVINNPKNNVKYQQYKESIFLLKQYQSNGLLDTLSKCIATFSLKDNKIVTT